jgi:signal transduction histidine kinase
VVVSTEVGDGSVALVVADSGIGIPPTERELLFRRFFRATTAIEGQIPGTGPGLAIPKAIAGAHGGTITVADAPGRGTVFRVELPLARGLEEAA